MNSKPTPLRLGLTGGIGSGKSTVSERLVQHGAALLDADAISRATTAAGGSAMAAIAQQFGPEFVDDTGALDRAAMRQLVYADPGARARLQAIVHPLVGQDIQRRAEQAQANGKRVLVFDIPLLVESLPSWRPRLDRIVVVDCDRATQIARVQARDNLPLAQIEAILNAQATREQRRAAADHLIANGAGVSLAQLQRQVDALARQLGLLAAHTHIDTEGHAKPGPQGASAVD